MYVLGMCKCIQSIYGAVKYMVAYILAYWIQISWKYLRPKQKEKHLSKDCLNKRQFILVMLINVGKKTIIYSIFIKQNLIFKWIHLRLDWINNEILNLDDFPN